MSDATPTNATPEKAEDAQPTEDKQLPNEADAAPVENNDGNDTPNGGK